MKLAQLSKLAQRVLAPVFYPKLHFLCWKRAFRHCFHCFLFPFPNSTLYVCHSHVMPTAIQTDLLLEILTKLCCIKALNTSLKSCRKLDSCLKIPTSNSIAAIRVLRYEQGKIYKQGNNFIKPTAWPEKQLRFQGYKSYIQRPEDST